MIRFIKEHGFTIAVCLFFAVFIGSIVLGAVIDRRNVDAVVWDASGQAYSIRGRAVRKLELPPGLRPACLTNTQPAGATP